MLSEKERALLGDREAQERLTAAGGAVAVFLRKKSEFVNDCIKQRTRSICNAAMRLRNYHECLW